MYIIFSLLFFSAVDDLKPKESKLKGVKTMPNFQNIHSADPPKFHQSSTQATSLKRNESSGTDLGMHKDSSSMKVGNRNKKMPCYFRSQSADCFIN